jgi:hypothetical protein
MTDVPLAPNRQRMFRATGFWKSNHSAAILAGILAGLFILVMGGLLVWSNPTRETISFAAFVLLFYVLFLLSYFPGNLSAQYPYAVLLEEGRGLELRAVLNTVYIPAEDLRDVRRSYFQGGYVVRLNRRRRLLTSFTIAWFFGEQAEPLANAIREEIRSHGG